MVEDSAAVRERLVGMMQTVPGFELAGVAETAEEAIAGVAQSEPQAVTLDLSLKTGSGMEVLRAAKRMSPAPVVIVLTINDSPRYRERCRLLGADHFFSKSTEFTKVVSVLAELDTAL